MDYGKSLDFLLHVAVILIDCAEIEIKRRMIKMHYSTKNWSLGSP
jgi:hypothetical protein